MVLLHQSLYLSFLKQVPYFPRSQLGHHRLLHPGFPKKLLEKCDAVPCENVAERAFTSKKCLKMRPE
jgi:hypothetical protein